jgi:hypothetical protein
MEYIGHDDENNSKFNEKDWCFAGRQESVRKRVECTFNILQSRFNITHCLARMWKIKDDVNIVACCIILDNTITKTEKRKEKKSYWLEREPRSIYRTTTEVSTQVNPYFEEKLQRNLELQNNSKHTTLKKNLVEHIWERYGEK